MRGAASMLIVAAIAAGCLGTSAPTTSTPTATSMDVHATPSGRLQDLPHLELSDAATLHLAIPNVTAHGLGQVPVLVHIAANLRLSRLHSDGAPLLLAFLPARPGNLTACAPLGPESRAQFRPRDAGTSHADGNLSATYSAGWYHLVLVSDAPAAANLTFESDHDLPPVRLPAPDPLLQTIRYQEKTGLRSASVDFVSQAHEWFSFATFEINGGSNTDGGRDLRLRYADDCAEARRTDSSVTIPADGRSLSTSAQGSQSRVTITGTYTPAFPGTAPSSTSLTHVSLGFRVVPS